VCVGRANKKYVSFPVCVFPPAKENFREEGKAVKPLVTRGYSAHMVYISQCSATSVPWHIGRPLQGIRYATNFYNKLCIHTLQKKVM
jgi:hypothetical protein